MSNIERDPWPRELWWCENPKCNEPSGSDPCDFCGESVVRYKVVPESQHRGAVEALEHIIESCEHTSPTIHAYGYIAHVARQALARLGGQ